MVIGILHKSFLNVNESQLKHWDAKTLEAGYTRITPFDQFDESKAVESVNMEILKAGQHLDRIILQYEFAEISSLLGPSSCLTTSTSTQVSLEDVLDDFDILEDDLWVEETFTIAALEYAVWWTILEI